ncbi:MAG: hypothetical protein WEB87_01235 [Bacteriovoracaceae bacterium]
MNINKDRFLKMRKEFELGKLTTESVNLKTKNLSYLAHDNLEHAIRALREVDLDSLNLFEKKLQDVYPLALKIKDALASGNKIFLSGCGATGRLSLAIETFWRFLNKNDQSKSDQVKSFMAGGDYALIKSVESFEDKMSYGSRQLEELGFSDKDFLVAITEGGETSFVIGSALFAKEKSTVCPHFIYCNPDHELAAIERSRKIIEDPAIEKLNLTVGPMAITGSTRMQATTIQMLAVSLALFLEFSDRRDFMSQAKEEVAGLKKLSCQELLPFIQKEAEIYQNKKLVTYLAQPLSAITILTDTTERSPTFSLEPFEKAGENHLSLAYLALKGTHNSEQAWRSLLQRDPRGLDWPDLDLKLDQEEIYKFDISESAVERRRRSDKGAETFAIWGRENDFFLRLGDLEGSLPKVSRHHVFNQIALKMGLNILSTLIMALMERYEGNVMTYVRPSNYKLIDRAARYVIELAKKENKQLDYLEVVNELFNQIPRLRPDEPVVLKTLEALKSSKSLKKS